MTERLRVGVVGVGQYAVRRHIPELRATGRAEVVAIARRSPEALASLRDALGVAEAYTDWRELLDRSQLDAVVITTAHASHAEIALAALERGLHVFVEKPLALTTADARRVVDAAARSGKIVQVGYLRRTLGAWRGLKEQLDAGAIGRVRQISMVFAQSIGWLWDAEMVPPAFLRDVPPGTFGDGRLAESWRRDPAAMGGGYLADTGTHLVDAALWLAGSPARTVSAFLEPAGNPTDRRLSVQARLANGVLVSLVGHSEVAGPPRARVTVLGDGGLAIGDGPLVTGEFWIQGEGERTPVGPSGPDVTPTAAFAAAVLDGAPNPAPPSEAARAVAFVEAAYRSAAEGRTVEVPETP